MTEIGLDSGNPVEDGVPLAMPDNVPIILSPLLCGWINDPRLYAA